MSRRLLDLTGVFFLVAALVFAGLGWVTFVALRVERAQREAAAQAELGNNLRVALWRLDGRMLPALGIEDSRPFNHYNSADPLSGSAAVPTPLLAASLPDWMKLHVQLDPATGWNSPQVLTPEATERVAEAWPELALQNNTTDRAVELRCVQQKYPPAFTCDLLAARERAIPDDALPFAAPLFTKDTFQELREPNSLPKSSSGATSNSFRMFGWEFDLRNSIAKKEAAPLVQSKQWSANNRGQIDYNNRANTIQRAVKESKNTILESPLNNPGNYQQNSPVLPDQKNGVAGSPATIDENRKTDAKDKSLEKHTKNQLPAPPAVNIHLGSMRPQWITAADGTETLVLVRAAKIDNKTVYQGVILDWAKLVLVLKEELRDLFPNAELLPVRDATGVSPDRAMAALPVQLDPGPAPELPPAGWSTLRVGLLLAWIAALIAVAAVGLGGWSLIDLAERRFRFVSAVTHELRTPLTSLRLYLDLLTSGMIHDETKRQEYLSTLATESERLHRLIDNVLDFAKLEKRRQNGDMKPIAIGELLDQLQKTWTDRVATDGKELVIVSTLPAEMQLCTDVVMVHQIVGNLIDNARKYTRDAADQRIWLWAKPGSTGRIVFEVEDRGVGIPARERRTVFKPFRRGELADVKAGGAGLGLALAKQWAEVLSGTLTYRPADGAPGACFRLELPAK